MNSSALGRQGEDSATEFLESRGFEILARNFRHSRGEIDIIARDQDTIVFVEVKSWTGYGPESLEHSIDARKIKRIIETAKIFLLQHRKYNCMSVRFDIIFIGPDGLRHLASAFTECVL